MLRGMAGWAVALGGCSKPAVHLRDVLSPARGRVVDGTGADVDGDALLASARDRPVTLSFAYIGCGGRVPKLTRILAAVHGLAADRALHLVFDAVDDPRLSPDVLRDVTGDDGAAGDVRILFIKKDDLWPRQNNRAVQGVLAAMDAPFGPDSYLQTINEIGLFDGRGEFLGLHY